MEHWFEDSLTIFFSHGVTLCPQWLTLAAIESAEALPPKLLQDDEFLNSQQPLTLLEREVLVGQRGG